MPGGRAGRHALGDWMPGQGRAQKGACAGLCSVPRGEAQTQEGVSLSLLLSSHPSAQPPRLPTGPLPAPQEAALARQSAEEARAQLGAEVERARSAVRAEADQAELMQRLEQLNLLRESNAQLR